MNPLDARPAKFEPMSAEEEQRQPPSRVVSDFGHLLRGIPFTLYGAPPECAITLWRERPLYISVRGDWDALMKAVREYLPDQK